MNNTRSWKNRFLICAIAVVTLLEMILLPRNVMAAETRTIPSSWQKTYYKYISKETYIKISFKKKDYTIKLYRKGKKTRTIEQGHYVTWKSESIVYYKNAKLMCSHISGILFEMHRKTGGRKILVEPYKHLHYCYQLSYIPGTYYQSKKTAQKHVQKI